MRRAALDEALLAAHAADDRAALVTLYADAAELSPRTAAFYLTHAYVFALEQGDPRASSLRSRLVALGAEQQSAPDVDRALQPMYRDQRAAQTDCR